MFTEKKFIINDSDVAILTLFEISIFHRTQATKMLSKKIIERNSCLPKTIYYVDVPAVWLQENSLLKNRS